MKPEIALNDFAIRSFRDIADQDYITARLAHRNHLWPQFLWASLQTIEKYFKCMLLLNRIHSKNVGHDLIKALRLINTNCPFQLRISEGTTEFIEYLNTYGRFRYLEASYFTLGYENLHLDRAVWEIRRYCKVLDYPVKIKGKRPFSSLVSELARIEEAETQHYHKFKIPGGLLEEIIKDNSSYLREPLVWKNFYYGSRRKRKIRVGRVIHSTNAPLSIRPEFVDEVAKYVHLPKDIKKHYQELNKSS